MFPFPGQLQCFQCVLYVCSTRVEKDRFDVQLQISRSVSSTGMHALLASALFLLATATATSVEWMPEEER